MLMCLTCFLLLGSAMASFLDLSLGPMGVCFMQGPVLVIFLGKFLDFEGTFFDGVYFEPCRFGSHREVSWPTVALC